MSPWMLLCVVLGFCFPVVQGLHCYFCRHNQNIGKCMRQKECPAGQVCQVRVYLNDNHSHPIFHYGCTPKIECDKFNHHHIGGTPHPSNTFLSHHQKVCSGCCDTSDGCNMKICSKYLSKTTTTTTTTAHTTKHHAMTHKTTTTTSSTPSTIPSTTTVKPTTAGSLYTATFYHGQQCIDHEDESLSCANLAAHGYCTLINNMEYVYQVAKERCRKTCGFC